MAKPLNDVIALGASNTAGYGVGAGYAYPAVIERLLQERGLAVTVGNEGISGNTTGQMLARLDASLPPGTRVVLFQPGSNDARQGIPEAERERNISAILWALRQRGIVVIRVAIAFETARAGNLQADGIHYTVGGHDKIGRLLVDQVARALGY